MYISEQGFLFFCPLPFYLLVPTETVNSVYIYHGESSPSKHVIVLKLQCVLPPFLLFCQL